MPPPSPNKSYSVSDGAAHKKNATQKHVGPHAGAWMPPPTGVTTNVRVRACVRGSEKNVGVEGYAVSMQPPQQHTCSTQAPRGQPQPMRVMLGPIPGREATGKEAPSAAKGSPEGCSSPSPQYFAAAASGLPSPQRGPAVQNPKERSELQVTHHTSPASVPPAAGPPSCTPPGASPSARARHCGLCKRRTRA